ncbi:efflux RND transporter periplasmic adaptor subunit [Parahaliea aestuarii]|uniref:Efflux RND transporter periplasmic adaptor subunit n=1 Tax=Parahaliea aestuarii TaxID=1852021 RepID=A0A5C8ZR74_9GAMM|nr:efflux RND transporter periplasmic adaptor subunit [Parahaliea aestuarii]TXS89997.1 efflux RND transporter periplasmic adaptor subunit [Parahaliea aestuarii]
MNLRKFWPLGLILLAVAGCEKSAAPAPERTVRAVPVELWTAQPSTIEDRIESVATLSAFESVVLTARVTSGKVSAVHFDDGDTVEKGQLLLELDTTEPAARVREVEASLREATLDLERLGRLGADISTRAALDIARANVSAEEARLDQARAALADHRLHAPFSGTLGFRQVSVGALITPGTVVTELDDTRRLKMDFTIPEVYLSRIGVGDRVEAYSPAWPEDVFVATVRSVGTRVDPITRAVTVRGVLDNASGRLRPGMLLTVDLLAGETSALVLPEQTLIQDGQSSYVYSVDADNLAVRVPVEVARRVGGGVVIEGGIESGQPVVIRGQVNLRPGIPVAVMQATGQVELGNAP